MRKIYCLLFVFGLFGLHLNAQTFPIGHKTATYNDPNRTGGFGSGGGAGRQIQVEVYYPATTTGDNVPVANGSFPIIVFGHGFVMSWDAYTNIWEHYVALGYIMVFPRTEGGFSPSHADFGKDLVIAASRLEQECGSSANPLYQKWNGRTGVMGHSMGGGSTFLAASEVGNSFDVLIGMAPAETNPSAIAAAATITIPALVFSGSEDAVTPPADHHIPIYNAIPSGLCKQFATITGGAHCYFANSNAACDFGESSSGGNITIDRATQQDILFDLLDPYLGFYLQQDCAQWSLFSNQLTTDPRIVGTNDCLYNPPTAPFITQNGTILSIPAGSGIQWYLDGTILPTETGLTMDAANYGGGIYTVSVTDGICLAESDGVVLLIGISEQIQNTFSISPNPTENDLLISVKDGIEYIDLIDARGVILKRIKCEPKQTLVVSELPAGIYFLRSEVGEMKRFIKR